MPLLEDLITLKLLPNMKGLTIYITCEDFLSETDPPMEYIDSCAACSSGGHILFGRTSLIHNVFLGKL